ncbi:MAG: hypothetical protein ABJN42_04845 [Roseibium sp.]|uniref:hypothetical protein n=1 Tax=Roseibium sp. TaxID=1936156 RepID=UPI00329A372A
MITERMNPRLTMLNWLQGLKRAAQSGPDEYLEDKILEMSEPMMAMTASSEAADPIKMRALLERDDFSATARKYLIKNWPLNIGLREGSSELDKARYDEKILKGVNQALAGIWFETGPVTEASGKALSDRIDAVAEKLTEDDRDLHGEGTGILLREVIGLPGDAYVCALIQDEDVLENALLGLRQLGVQIEPSAFEDIGREDPEAEAEPELGI